MDRSESSPSAILELSLAINESAEASYNKSLPAVAPWNITSPLPPPLSPSTTRLLSLDPISTTAAESVLISVYNLPS